MNVKTCHYEKSLNERAIPVLVLVVKTFFVVTHQKCRRMLQAMRSYNYENCGRSSSAQIPFKSMWVKFGNVLLHGN